MSFCLSCAQRKLASNHTIGQFLQLKSALFLKPSSDIQAKAQVFWSREVWTQMHHLLWPLQTECQVCILCLCVTCSGFTVPRDLHESQAQTHGQAHFVCSELWSIDPAFGICLTRDRGGYFLGLTSPLGSPSKPQELGSKAAAALLDPNPSLEALSGALTSPVLDSKSHKEILGLMAS